jgi:hypothetical protein
MLKLKTSYIPQEGWTGIKYINSAKRKKSSYTAFTRGRKEERKNMRAEFVGR